MSLGKQLRAEYDAKHNEKDVAFAVIRKQFKDLYKTPIKKILSSVVDQYQSFLVEAATSMVRDHDMLAMWAEKPLKIRVDFARLEYGVDDSASMRDITIGPNKFQNIEASAQTFALLSDTGFCNAAKQAFTQLIKQNYSQSVAEVLISGLHTQVHEKIVYGFIDLDASNLFPEPEDQYDRTSTVKIADLRKLEDNLDIHVTNIKGNDADNHLAVSIED